MIFSMTYITSMMILTNEGFLLLAVEKLNDVARTLRTSVREINCCQWSTNCYCFSIFVVELSFIRLDCVAITFFEVSLKHVGWKGTHHVSCRFISANDIRALHTILF